MRTSAKAWALGAVAALLPLAAAAQAAGYVPLGVDGVESEEARLERAQFEPIAAVAAANRTVRRVTYRDPFANTYAPAVLLEKDSDGGATFTVTANGGKVKETGKLTAQEWASLVAMDAALAPPKPVLRANAEVCHAKLMVIEAADGGKARRRNASMCGGEGDFQAMAYAYKVAELAVDKIEKCERFAEPTREPSWRLAACLQPPRRRGADQD